MIFPKKPEAFNAVLYHALCSSNPNFLFTLVNWSSINFNAAFVVAGSNLTPLQLLALHCNEENGVDKVKILVEQAEVDVNHTVSGNSPLHLALENGNIEVAQLLLDHRANVNNINLTDLLSSSFFIRYAENDHQLIPFLRSLYHNNQVALQQIDQFCTEHCAQDDDSSDSGNQKAIEGEEENNVNNEQEPIAPQPQIDTTNTNSSAQSLPFAGTLIDWTPSNNPPVTGLNVNVGVDVDNLSF